MSGIVRSNRRLVVPIGEIILSHPLSLEEILLDAKQAAEKLFEKGVTATEFEVPEGLSHMFKRPRDAKVFADWVGKYMTDLLATATATA